MLHPICNLAVQSFLNCQMTHHGVRPSSVPVLFSRWNPNGVARPDYPGRATSQACKSHARNHMQRLPKWMRVPCGSCSRFKGNHKCADPRRLLRLNYLVLPYPTCKPVCGRQVTWTTARNKDFQLFSPSLQSHWSFSLPTATKLSIPRVIFFRAAILTMLVHVRIKPLQFYERRFSRHPFTLM